jgi:cobalamin biosynthesis Mg chelatase CobN
MPRLVAPALIVLFAAGLASGCGAGGGLTGTVGTSATRTLPTVTRTGVAAPATTEGGPAQPTTEESAPPPSTVVVTTTQPATVTQTHTQTETHTQTKTETISAAPTPTAATTTLVNTGAAVVAGAAGAAAVASQAEETESTPWGWVAFGILAAALLIFAIVWLVRRHRSPGPPSAPAPGA